VPYNLNGGVGMMSERLEEISAGGSGLFYQVEGIEESE
jgi:hypothetical protein